LAVNSKFAVLPANTGLRGALVIVVSSVVIAWAPVAAGIAAADCPAPPPTSSPSAPSASSESSSAGLVVVMV
jgi:hypothetical protein